MACPLLRVGVVLAGLLGIILLAPLPAAPPDPEPKLKEAVQAAIQKGVRYLKKIHEPSPTYAGGSYGAASASLAGLAFLESGVPPNDPMLRNMASLVRDQALRHNYNYYVCLFLLFLDRLGQKGDVPLVQYLGARLLAGQGSDGTWTYGLSQLSQLSQEEVTRLHSVLVRDVRLVGTPRPSPPPKGGTVPRDDLPKDPDNRDPAPKPDPKKDKDKPEPKPPAPPAQGRLHPEAENLLRLANQPKRPPRNAGGDHSNTQFATMGVWVARKHGLPVDKALEALDKHYRDCQNPDGGWGYTEGASSTASMTCAGLMGLAVAAGAREAVLQHGDRQATPPSGQGKPVDAVRDPTKDEAIQRGLAFLGKALHAAVGPMAKDDDPKKPRRHYRGGELGKNLYLAWSLERVGVVYSLETIGNVDWYACLAEALVASQQADGSWGEGEVDTCFALLVLNRANLAPDLTRTLTGKVRDPSNHQLGSIDPADLTKILGKGDEPSNKGGAPKTAPKVEPDAKTFDAEADRLANAVVAATGSQRDKLLANLRDARGAVHTEALIRVIRRLDDTGQKEARDALATRLTRMRADTLRDMLKDPERELRRAAALACAMKEDRGHVPDLIGALADKEDLVTRAARAALKTLTGQDFGPESASAEDKSKAQIAWRDWWSKNGSN